MATKGDLWIAAIATGVVAALGLADAADKNQKAQMMAASLQTSQTRVLNLTSQVRVAEDRARVAEGRVVTLERDKIELTNRYQAEIAQLKAELADAKTAPKKTGA